MPKKQAQAACGECARLRAEIQSLELSCKNAMYEAAKWRNIAETPIQKYLGSRETAPSDITITPNMALNGYIRCQAYERIGMTPEELNRVFHTIFSLFYNQYSKQGVKRNIPALIDELWGLLHRQKSMLDGGQA